MNKWISVKDELPKVRESVLCWVECELCRKGIPHGHKAIYMGYPYNGVFINWVIDHKLKEFNEKGIIYHKDISCEPEWHTGPDANITHWIRLPDPPDIKYEESQNTGENNG